MSDIEKLSAKNQTCSKWENGVCPLVCKISVIISSVFLELSGQVDLIYANYTLSKSNNVSNSIVTGEYCVYPAVQWDFQVKHLLCKMYLTLPKSLYLADLQ